MRSLYETPLYSPSSKYQAAKCLNIGMSYSVIDGLVLSSHLPFVLIFWFNIVFMIMVGQLDGLFVSLAACFLQINK